MIITTGWKYTRKIAYDERIGRKKEMKLLTGLELKGHQDLCCLGERNMFICMYLKYENTSIYTYTYLYKHWHYVLRTLKLKYHIRKVNKRIALVIITVKQSYFNHT